jgi:hypothetical protein
VPVSKTLVLREAKPLLFAVLAALSALACVPTGVLGAD